MRDFEPHLAKVDALARGDAVLRGRLETVIDLAVRIMPRCDTASAALVLEGRAATIAVTDHVALEADIVQYRSQEGPCLDAIRGGGKVVRVDLVNNGSAYRRFAPGAFDVGINSVLSVPLHERGRLIGSLNLYSTAANAFDATSEREAEPFAAAAAEAIIEAPILPLALSVVDDIVMAMEDESVVDQAIRLVMRQRACSADTARQVLSGIAESRGLTERHAAEAIIADPTVATRP